MHWVDIEYNRELTINLFREYFQYERKKLLSQMPTFVMIGIALVFMLIGFLSSMTFFIYMGIATIIIIVFAVLFYLIRFKRSFDAFLADIDNSPASAEKRGRFGFDKEKIVYQTSKYRNEISWEKIKNFEWNGSEIYLFLDKNQLLDIYSPKIMGEESFDKFVEVITENFTE